MTSQAIARCERFLYATFEVVRRVIVRFPFFALAVETTAPNVPSSTSTLLLSMSSGDSRSKLVSSIVSLRDPMAPTSTGTSAPSVPRHMSTMEERSVATLRDFSSPFLPGTASHGTVSPDASALPTARSRVVHSAELLIVISQLKFGRSIGSPRSPVIVS